MVLFPCVKCCGVCTCTDCVQLRIRGSDIESCPCRVFNGTKQKPFKGYGIGDFWLDEKRYTCGQEFLISCDEVSGADVLVGRVYLAFPKVTVPVGSTPAETPLKGKAVLLVRIVNGPSGGWSADYEVDVERCPSYPKPPVDPAGDPTRASYSITFTKDDMVASTGDTEQCGDLTFLVQECLDDPPPPPPDIACCCIDGQAYINQTEKQCEDGGGDFIECSRQDLAIRVDLKWCGIEMELLYGGTLSFDPVGRKQYYGQVCTKAIILNPPDPDLCELRDVEASVLVYAMLWGLPCDEFGMYFAGQIRFQTFTIGQAFRISDDLSLGASGNIKTYIFDYNERTNSQTLTLDMSNTDTTPNWCGNVGHLICDDDEPQLKVSFFPYPT